jgi:hypothetical protein
VDLGAFRANLAAKLQTADPNLSCYPVVIASPQVPAAIVEIGSFTVHADFDAGDSDIPFSVTVLVGLSDWRTAQETLDSYCSIGTGGRSLVDAMESSDQTIQVDTIGPQVTADIGNDSFAAVTFSGRWLAG